MPRKAGKAKAQRIQIGNKQMCFGKYLQYMKDSNDLYEKKDFDGLRLKLETEGFIWIRNLIPENIILAARHAMLKQANLDGSIVTDSEYDLDRAKMAGKGKTLAQGYVFDGVTGAETNCRTGINAKKWAKIGPSDICKKVYNGESIQEFWKSLFGEKCCDPLVRQTFCRLMGDSGTIEHADYYYFKRDTDVFSGEDGINAMDAMKEYLTENDLWESAIYELEEKEASTDEEESAEEESTELECGVCGKKVSKNSLDPKRSRRLDVHDFGTEGKWHCPTCARHPLAVYTTWMSLSNLVPTESVLAVCPYSHKLTEWDLPKKNSQIPGDFNWKLPWVIPQNVGLGDIIVFNIKTIHAASKNTSVPRRFRCSFDTRIQLVPKSFEDVLSSSDKENTLDVIGSPPAAKKRRISVKRRTKKHQKNVPLTPHPGIKVTQRDEEESSASDEEEENEENRHVSEKPVKNRKKAARGKRVKKNHRDENEISEGIRKLKL